MSLLIRKSVSLSLNAPLCSRNHTIKSVLDHLLIQRFASRNDCLTQLSKIPWLLIKLHVPNCLLQIAPKKKVTNCQIRRAWGPGLIAAFAHYSTGKLSSKKPHRRVACVTWSAVLLPPHIMPIDIVDEKISLDDVIANYSQVFSAVEISFDKMWTQNNTCSCQSNPYHHLVGALRKFNIMIRRVAAPFAAYFMTFLEFISSEFKLKIASSDTISWSRKSGFCPTVLTNRLQNANRCCGSPSLSWCLRIRTYG